MTAPATHLQPDPDSVSPISAEDFVGFLRRLLSRQNSHKLRLAILVLHVDASNRVATTAGREQSVLVQNKYRALLRDCLNRSAVVEWIGDRKFGVILPGVADERTATALVERLTHAARPSASINGKRVFLDMSAGISLYPTQASDAEELVRRAELALEQARNTRAGHQLYKPNSTVQVASLLHLESDLEAAVERGEITVNFQPQICVETGAKIGAEALMRWQSAERGSVPPDVFIPVAERTGALAPMTWALFKQVAKLAQDLGPLKQKLDMAINVSPSVLIDPELTPQIKSIMAAIEDTSVELTLEVTEQAFMQDPQACQVNLHRLRAQGVRISIDDFGTGFSSMAYLRQLPAQELKIDQSFIRPIRKNETDYNIVKAMVALARALDMSVVAEGVEDLDTLNVLAELGIDVAQGYFIAQPMSAKKFLDWM